MKKISVALLTLLLLAVSLPALAGGFQMDHDSIDFGTYVEGYSPSPETVTLSNLDAVSKTVAFSYSGDGVFNFPAVDVEIPANGSVDIEVLVDAAFPGTYQGELTITCGDEEWVLPLFCKVEEGIIVTYDDMDFGTLVLGDDMPDPKTVMITNNCPEAVNINVHYDTEDFAIDMSSGKHTFAAGETKTLSVSVLNETAGEYFAGLSIYGQTKTVNIDMHYSLVEPSNRALADALTVNPSAVDFGTIYYNEPAPEMQEIWLINNGEETLNISVVNQNEDDFYCDEHEHTIDLGAGDVYPVYMVPLATEIGEYTSTVVITAEGYEDKIEVPVNVEVLAKETDITVVGDLKVMPNMLNFGSITEGDEMPDQKRVILTNIGDKDLIVKVSNNNEVAFDCQKSGEYLEIAPGELVYVSVAPITEEVGDYEGNVSFLVEEKDEEVIVALDFQVEEDPYKVILGDLRVSPKQVDFGTITEGTVLPDPESIYLTNMGSESITVTIENLNDDAFFCDEDDQTHVLDPDEKYIVFVEPINESVGVYTSNVIITVDGCAGEISVPLDFEVEEEEAQGPYEDLAIDPAELDFGSITEGDELPAVQTITLTNNGDEDITVAAINLNSDGFFCDEDGKSFTVEAGGEYAVQVNPIAEAVGVYTGDIVFTVDGYTGESSVSLSFQVEEAAEPELIISPDELDFGTIAPDMVHDAINQKVLTIKNVGNATAKMRYGIAIGKFAFVTECNDELAPGEEMTPILKPSVTEPGEHTDTVTISDGTNTYDVELTVTIVEKQPEVTVTPTEVNFGDVYADEIDEVINQLQVVLENEGEGDAELTYTLSNGFAFVTDPADELAAGENMEITLKPATTEPGEHTGTLTISDGTNTYDVELTVTIVEKQPEVTVTPTEVDFGAWTQGDTENYPAAQTVTVSNTGTGEAEITVTADDESFTVTPDTLTLAPEETATVSVVPAVTEVGTYSTVLTFWDGQTVTATFAVEEAGIGGGEDYLELTIDPDTLAFGSVQSGQAAPEAKTVTVTNTGTLTATVTAQVSKGYFNVTGAEELEPGDSCTLTVKPLEGMAVGIKDDVLTISDGENDYEVVLTYTVTGDDDDDDDDGGNQGGGNQGGGNQGGTDPDEPNPGVPDPDQPKPEFPPTGDVANPALWAGMMAAAALLLPKRKRK